MSLFYYDPGYCSQTIITTPAYSSQPVWIVPSHTTYTYVPAVQPAPLPVQNDLNTVIINVFNSNGSMTPVKLRREGNTYVGPKGEFYLYLPSAEQLKPLYGF